MKVDLVIKNGWVVNQDGRARLGVAIDGERVVAVDKETELPAARRTVDADGRFLLPGVIDPHQHLGFGGSLEEEWRTETRSTVAGGVTSISNYMWHADSYLEHFDEDLHIAESNSLVDFSFEPLMISSEHNLEIERLAERGVGGFKWFTCYKGDEGRPWGITACDDGIIWDGFCRVAALGRRACAKLHVENIELISKIRDQVLLEGGSDLAAWADSRPGIAEASDMIKMIYLAKQAGVRLYILHISSREGVNVLVSAKADRGELLLAETCPHYLSLTKYSRAGVHAKVIPPIQDSVDQDKLWEAIQAGVITVIGSDHAATSLNDKQGDVWQAKQGFAGTATILPVMLSEGHHKRNVPLETIVAVTSAQTARWYGHFPRKGAIRVGSDADIVVVDLERRTHISPDVFQSRADFCLHDGLEFTGWPVMTVVRGKVVMQDGEVSDDYGWGRFQPVVTNAMNDSARVLV